MSNHIEPGTVEMIRIALLQRAKGVGNQPERAGLLLALDIVTHFCAIPAADAAIANAMRSAQGAMQLSPRRRSTQG